jgi:hypothetical protein
MKSVIPFLLSIVLLAISTMASPADASRRRWRVYHGIGAISHNVITPWYYGYHPTHYSYFPPDPMPGVQAIVLEDCWSWSFGHRYWACW